MALSEIEKNRSDARRLEAKIIHFYKVKPTKEELDDIYKERDRLVALDPRHSYLGINIVQMLRFHNPLNNPNIYL